MNKSKKFSAEVRERAIRMVQEHRDDYPWLWAAVKTNAPMGLVRGQKVSRHQLHSAGSV
jgi:hypothetical protein